MEAGDPSSQKQTLMLDPRFCFYSAVGCQSQIIMASEALNVANNYYD